MKCIKVLSFNVTEMETNSQQTIFSTHMPLWVTRASCTLRGSPLAAPPSACTRSLSKGWTGSLTTKVSDRSASMRYRCGGNKFSTRTGYSPTHSNPSVSPSSSVLPPANECLAWPLMITPTRSKRPQSLRSTPGGWSRISNEPCPRIDYAAQVNSRLTKTRWFNSAGSPLS